MAATLDAWRDAFERQERCPWPGPRPLTVDDPPHLLCGRDADNENFRHEVDTHRLVFLTGSSGVGKTSLLRSGLVPGLERADYKVAICRDWSGSADETDSAAFLAARIAESLDRLGDPDLPRDVSILPYLNDTDGYGENVVLVLDQFEELLRDETDFKDDLFAVLADLNHLTSIKVVISLRSEYLHELRPLEHRAQPFTISHFFLEEVAAERALDVVTAGNVSQPGAIDDRAAEHLARLWADARSAGRLRSQRTGLLHLQALLYALHARSHGETITLDTIDLFLGAVTDRRGNDDPRTVFSVALEASVEVKLERCRAASLEVGLDAHLVEGTAHTLSRSVRHLSSAGYKLVRDAADLAEATMADELESLRRGIARSRGTAGADGDGPLGAGQFRAVFDALVRTVLTGEESAAEGRSGALDLLTVTRDELAAVADELAPEPRPGSWADRLHPGASPLDADRGEVTCGPMLGLAPAAVLIEELRRFAFALEWLRASSLARISTPGTTDLMIALIHDGFGTALERWSREQDARPAAALHALTAPQGADFYWFGADRSMLPEFDGGLAEAGKRYFANLRWRGAWIMASFRSCMFVNCDFRGSVFNECRFEGATFVNCLLDGAMFSDCTIAGTPSSRPEEWSDDPPQYLVEDSERMAAFIASYRESGPSTSSSSVFSQLPGLPAIAGCPDGEVGVVRSVDAEPGGLVIYGGRVSTLAARNLTFESGGRFCLRETAGSGFDVIEHDTPGSYEIFGSSVRHLTFTSPPTRAEGGDDLQLDIHGSAVFQAWVGHDISGSARITNSRLLSFWNGSPTFDAQVAEGSTYHGLTNVHLADDTNTPIVSDERQRTLAELDPDGRNTRIAISMDYRRFASLPSVFEAPSDRSNGAGGT